LLRHHSFKGLREDKPAGQVKREIAAATPDSRADHISNRTVKRVEGAIDGEKSRTEKNRK
jgi:hypothetical protein